MALSEGVRLGPYQIVAPLGAGGIGRVYTATDTRLNRTVAIKVLADWACYDPQQRRRFEQEARAVSALNHPNICVVYDVGCETPSDGGRGAQDSSTPSGPLQFLVMEHLEGEDLAKRLRRDGVSFDEALDIGAQVASALAAAHRRGVVHRDLKPGNIMLTRSPSGVQAKLLDFGLAKCRPPQATDLEPTRSHHGPDTRPGTMLGTLPYMSPEQIEDRPTDARTDIFALGCVLYEMLTGQRAFRGDSEDGLIAAIKTHEPEPVTALQPDTPAALDHLIRRCLQKDPDQRAESAHDLADELRWLREAHRPLNGGDGRPRRRATDSVSRTDPAPAPQPPRPPRRWHRPVLVFSLLAIAVVTYGVSTYWRGSWSVSADPFRGAKPLQVTSRPGLNDEPAVSPDGSHIAYVSDEDGTAHIWVMSAAGTDNRPLTTGDEPNHDPAWAPDGTAVLFTRHQGGRHSIWAASRFGGSATLVLDDAAQPAVSPDGTRLAFVRDVPPSGRTRVFVANMQDLSRPKQVTHEREGLWDHGHPSWSPDGRWLCYHGQYSLWMVSDEGLDARALTADNKPAEDPVWSPDGEWVYFSSSRDGTPAIWKVSVEGGTPKRVTSGTNWERQPSIGGDPWVLVWTAGPADFDLVLHEMATGQERTFGTGLQDVMPRFTSDGQAVAFVSGPTTSRNDLWVQPLVGGWPDAVPRPLTDFREGEVDHPAVSPDNRWVAFYRVVKGQRDIWIVPWGYGPPTPITTDPDSDIQPAWSHDGKFLTFASERGGGRFSIWKVPMVDGRPEGNEVVVTVGANPLAPEWSPDDEWIAYVDGGTAADGDVWKIRADGSGTAQRVTTGAGALRVRWPRSDQMVVVGMWGGHALSLRLVDPETGVPTEPPHPVILSDDVAACDFDIDRDRDLAVFARCTRKVGHIWTLARQQ